MTRKILIIKKLKLILRLEIKWKNTCKGIHKLNNNNENKNYLNNDIKDQKLSQNTLIINDNNNNSNTEDNNYCKDKFNNHNNFDNNEINSKKIIN